MTHLAELGEITVSAFHLQDLMSRAGVGRAVAARRQTNDFGLLHSALAAGNQIAAHFHRTFSESFYVLSGHIERWNG